MSIVSCSIRWSTNHRQWINRKIVNSYVFKVAYFDHDCECQYKEGRKINHNKWKLFKYQNNLTNPHLNSIDLLREGSLAPRLWYKTVTTDAFPVLANSSTPADVRTHSSAPTGVGCRSKWAALSSRTDFVLTVNSWYLLSKLLLSPAVSDTAFWRSYIFWNNNGFFLYRQYYLEVTKCRAEQTFLCDFLIYFLYSVSFRAILLRISEW